MTAKGCLQDGSFAGEGNTGSFMSRITESQLKRGLITALRQEDKLGKMSNLNAL